MTKWSGKLIWTAVGGCAIVLLAGYELQRQLRTRVRAAARQELAAVAELKVRQIATWREERLADARFFSQARFVADDLQAYLLNPSSDETVSAVDNWLALLKHGDRYATVVLLDGALQPRASLPADATFSIDRVRFLFERASATGDVAFSDLHLDDANGRPQQQLLLPIYADPERRTGSPLGAVLIQVDPEQLLYPLIQSWPTPSRTAETLLIRQDGNDVLYLTPLRHRDDSALRFRLPIGSDSLPAARVLQGQLDPQEGIDYRGVPVVYVGRHVPGTSWAMISKMDQEELYASARQQTLIAVLVASSLVLATLHVFNVFWQRRNARLASQLRVQAAALEAAANGIVLTGPNGAIEWVNPAFTRLTGYTPQEVVGRNPRLLRSGLHGVELYRELWDTILAGRPWHGELINRRKDGTLYTEEMTITPVRDVRGRIAHFVGIKQDVSRRKHAEQEQARMRDELETLVLQRTALLRELVDELEHFSYSITHDMRAPLRAMNTYAVMLRRKHAGDLSAEALDYVARIEAAATRLDALIRDALNYSKALRTELPLHPVDLGPLLRGMLDSYPDLQPPAAQIAIEFDSLLVNGNEAALTQCFSNLLGNAVKFVAPGVKPNIRVSAEERTAADGSPRVRVSVHDNGIGIPVEAQQTIFGMFHRLHGPNEYPGTGIGLALVRKVVQRMGGSVGVHSTPGVGSVFWIELQPSSRHANPQHPAS